VIRAPVSRRSDPEDRPCYAQRPVASAVTIEIPMPPSTNSLFANKRGGRMKTAAYRAWRNNAVLVGSLPRPARIEGLCDVVVHLPPFAGDTDNRVKPCLDAAKEIGVIADDGERFVRNVSIIREPAGTMVRMVFTAIAGGPA
jgi:crossover junction endodeoxyribonuclease RusA